VIKVAFTHLLIFSNIQYPTSNLHVTVYESPRVYDTICKYLTCDQQLANRPLNVRHSIKMKISKLVHLKCESDKQTNPESSQYNVIANETWMIGS